MERLLRDGWFLATWRQLDDWPDTWALIRDWAATDPTQNPTDPIHQMQYGATVVRDLVGFWSDDTAVARRIRLADKATQWSRSGPAIETVTSAIALAAPEECYREHGPSDFRWAAMTTPLLAFFRAHDWQLVHTDGDGGRFRYPHGVGSKALDRPRFHRGQAWGPLGIVPASCDVSPDLEARFTGWRVQTGCEAHRGERETTRFDAPDLAETIRRFESATETADLAALAYCVVYGNCSTREWDLSTEYPAASDGALPPIAPQLSGDPQ